MSRKVNLDKPLSEQDMAYLVSRDRHAEVAFNAARHGTELPDDVRDALKTRGITVPTAESASAGSGTSEGTRTPDGDDSTASGATGGTGDAPEGEAPAFGSDEWFESATVPMFKEALAKRNLPVTGKRDELADRLADALDSEEDFDPEDEDAGN